MNTMKNSKGVRSSLLRLLGYPLEFERKMCKKWSIQCEVCGLLRKFHFLSRRQQLRALPKNVHQLKISNFHGNARFTGTPSVLYTEGSMYLYVSAAYLVVMPVTALIFMPVFRRVNSLSAFIYLERRFGKFIALVSCVIYLFHMTIYMGIVLYAPALALSAVTGLSLEGSIITVSVVCLFYTVIGGMKAIIWTDALQTIVMTVGMIVVCIVGTIKLGGLSVVYEISNQGNHLIYDEFSLDPRRRHAGFDCIVGGLFTWLTIYSANQAQVQRYISIGRKVDAQKAIFLNLPGLVFLMFVSGYGGLLAYTKYALCDPIQKGDIFKADQILPFFVIDTFGDWYGFSGLFVSSIFSGSLSTISSGVNALAAVVLTNMIPPHKLSETTRAKLGKGMAVGFGLAALGFAFLCKYLEAILPLALALNGILAGPMLGIFVLGMLSRRSTNIGATVGYFVGLALQGELFTYTFVGRQLLLPQIL